MEDYSSLEIQCATSEARKCQEFRKYHRRAGFEKVRLFIDKVGKKSKNGKGQADVPLDPADNGSKNTSKLIKMSKAILDVRAADSFCFTGEPPIGYASYDLDVSF
eukprot:scaffold31046_cov157-Amphora_coffeaeformis.AAC.2